MDKALLQRQALALEEQLLLRSKEDPLRDWTPTKKQRPFVDAILDEKTRQAWFLAANRSGKSDAGAFVGSTLSRYGPKNPKSLPHDGATIQIRDRATSGWVVSLDYNTSRDIIQPKYFDNEYVPPGSHLPFIPNREIAEWKKADQVLKLKNGSLIGFKNTESSVVKFQGTGKDWIHFDEEPPKPHFDECMIRVEAGRPLTVFGTCTLLPPEGVVGGVSWIYGQIIKPFLEKRLPNVMLFGASIYDNPHIGANEIKFLEAVYPDASPIRRIRLDGEWLPGIGGARAYPAFNSRLHVRPQGQMNPRKPICWVWDFNVTPLVTLIGQRELNLFRLYDELIMEEGNIPEMCQMFYDFYGKHMGEIWIYGDATGKRRTTNVSKSDYAMISNEMIRYNFPLRMKVPDVNPPVPDRLNAVNRTLRNEDGTIEVEVDPKCRELIDDLEQVLRDPRGGIKKSHKHSDPYYRRTHTSDALGYWIVYESPVRLVNARRKGSYKIKDPSYAL
jgi:phage terminase large subunit-like protein